MAKPKLFLDEDVHDGLGAALRREGFDAITAREAGRKQRSDREQLEFATSQERALLSFNLVHYEALAEEYFLQGKEHWGILVSPRRGFRDLFQRVLALLREVDAEDLKNQLIYL